VSWLLGLALGLALASAQAGTASEASGIEDPFAPVRVVKLDNGTQLVLAPNERSRTVQIELRVRVGFETETRETNGISHLLEHMLFKDSRLADNMSYLELIQEAHGSGNGYTSQLGTTYVATLPPEKAEWLVDLFWKMEYGRVFTDADVVRARPPVLLEIGEPGPFSKLMGSGLDVIAQPESLDAPDYWRTELGASYRPRWIFHERVNTLRFRAADLQAYYHEYYRPSNTTIFLSGRFDAAKFERLLRARFGAVADWPGGQAEEPPGTLRPGPHIVSTSTSFTSRIAVGTKLAKLDPETETVVKVYLEELAHRLMKELRNKRAESYSIRPGVAIREDYGYAVVWFEAPPEKFATNLAYVRDLIRREASEGGVTEAQFREATSLYLLHFKLRDADAGTMMNLAHDVERFRRVYHRGETPFVVFSRLTFEEYRRRLRAAFAPDRLYQSTDAPRTLFSLEGPALAVLAAAAFLWAARRWLAARFEHGRVRLVRKVALAPVYLCEVFVFLAGAAVASYAVRALIVAFKWSRALQSDFWLSEYLLYVVSTLVGVGAIVVFLGFLCRKVIVSGGSLYLKSATFHSRVIPLSGIESVELARPLSVLLSWKRLRRVGWRGRYLDACFWRPGVLVNLRDGRSWFLGMKAPEEFARELSAFTAPAQTP
jgi:predicted Zn-dependent peptidase